jgi:replicative DNA helicase
LSDHPIDIVAVDYFSYLAKTTTFDEASQSARRMKEIAKTNNITLVMLSQFNKQSQYTDKGGKTKEPTQNDLKGTGDIGASADVIYLIWRPALMGNMGDIDESENKYLTCLKVAKARKGLKQGQSHFKLYYDPETSRLSEKSLC